MKIAIFTYIMDRKAMGTALYTRQVVENILKIKQKDDEVFLVHRERNDDLLYRKANEIIMPRVKLPRLAHLISEAIFLRKTRSDFDVIYYPQESIYPLFWLSRAKIVITFNSSVEGWRDFGMKRRYRLVYWTFRLFHKRVSAIISVSETTKKSIQRFFNIDDKKIHVVYEGVSELYRRHYDKNECQNTMKARYGILSPYILNGSRVDPHKNIPRIIKAFHELKKSHNVPHKLVVGSKHWPEENQRVDALIKELGLENDVIFMPYIEEEDMPKLYAGAEMLVFASLHEGFGLPILEAMVMGTPVITSNVFAMPEVAGKAALIVNPYSVEEISSAMWRLLNDSALKESLIKLGKERMGGLSWEKMTRRIFEICRAL